MRGDVSHISLTVVTNDWHMDRTRTIFEKVFSLPLEHSASPSFASQSCDWHQSCLRLRFEPVPAGLPPDVEASRRAREKSSLASFNVLAGSGKINTFGELQNWMFSEHAAYAATRLTKDRAEVIDSEILKTY